MGCPSCGRGFHNECDTECEICHPEIQEFSKAVKTTSIHYGGRGAPTKDPENVTDPLSTGRKRAAQLYPIFRGEACEWQGKKNCGGGHPITGCVNGVQKDRHHGPVKNPLHNELGNVHRICKKCHNRWHAVNDQIYDEEEYKLLPHRPEAATEIELVANEAYWKVRR